MILAEAGLSECAGSDVPACGSTWDDLFFGVLLFFGFGFGSLLFGLVALCVVATMSVNEADLPRRSRIRWLLVLWLLPVVGLVVWWIAAITRYRAREADTTSRREAEE